jgi:DNA-binding NtrC family response regulator
MNFLVIDDDKTFRDATCFLIGEADHHAEAVGNGADGLAALCANEFDAVFLDVTLEPENGLDVLGDLQKQRPGIPVVMVTPPAGFKLALEAMQRGAADFLEKPFQREQFMTVLWRLQQFKQLSQRIQQLEQEMMAPKKQGLEPGDSPAEITGSGSVGDHLPEVGSLISLAQLEELHLRKILEKTPKLTEAAEILGIDQATLYRKRKKIGLK